MRKPLLASACMLVLSFVLSSGAENACWAQADRQAHRHQFEISTIRTRQAFRDVVANSRRSTVRLLAEKEVVALGLIVSSDGLIVTKSSQAQRATVAELSDGQQFPVQLLKSHRSRDLSFMKVEATGLPVVEWAQSAPKVGAWLATASVKKDPVAIGIMSVERRAIPASGERGVLGVELERNDIPKIRRVYPNSGAQLAGLEAGDVVMKVNQLDIATGQQLVKTLGRYRPGDTLELQIKRKEDDVSCQVTLTHPFGDFLSRIAFQNQMGGELSFRRDDFESVYQTDAVISPEDCGGPVVDLDGKAVGINIARAGRTDTYVLPSDLIQASIQEYLAENSQVQQVP
ncbi:PDZ domain-containing protein [Planctomicrobium sp. SH527]|uniref:S1C family serine protease n=1 Tax=Planctomicrobium sp. SH527 TaxID=3448123 RepID=UPI003F5BAC8A